MNKRTLTHEECRAHPEMRRRCGCGVQAKDISDEAVLAVIDEVKARTGSWTCFWDLEPVFPKVPRKVLLSKMRSMLRRGLVTGCGCGCRGDWERAGPSAVLTRGLTPPRHAE